MARRKQVTVISEADIARRAYELWEARGYPVGDGSEDWLVAQRELQEQSQPSETKRRWLQIPQTLKRLRRIRRAA